jgi:AmmeMemoRadiSam system protein B
MKPKLRNLEFTPVEHHGGEYFHVHDRHGFAENLLVPRAWGRLLALLDGTRDVAGLIFNYSLHHGETLERGAVERILAQLDEALLLESPNFQSRKSAVVRDFELESTRSAYCAGGSYPADAHELRARLRQYFESAAKIEPPAALPTAAKTRGVVVPHIDFRRGGVTEALAYQHLGEESFDTFVVLGIAHCGVAYPFCATDKDFETPLGTALCDRKFLNDLNARTDGKMLCEQYAHKHEHSVEFVAVFLQYLERFRNAKIVPIICGGFFDELRSGASPLNTPDTAQFVAALREVVSTHEARGRKIGLIASVDLAHVGSNFGDNAELNPRRLEEIKAQDLQFLHCIEAGDRDGVHAALARDNNARNVDAHPAVYTLLAAFPELRARLLDYRQAFDERANSVVSFAAMSLWS